MHIASMSLGIFDFLIEWIASLVGTVIGWFFDIVMQIVNRMIYSIAKQILFIVDAIQVLFRRLAGLDKYWIIENGQSVEKEGDILISLMSNKTILEVFITLTLVAVAMVIIATIIKVVQSEFTTEGSKNSKGGIIGQAIKSLIMFMLVPVLCFGGVLVSNALLKALDGATSNGGSESMASQVFVSAASSANKVRLGWFKLDDEAVEFINNGQPFNNVSQAANAIDNAFRTKKDYKKNPPANAGGIVETIVNTIFSSGPGMIANGVSTIGVATYENIYMVGTYYDIGQMNMIIMIGGAVMACYIMLITSFGLVMRLFKAVILFVISPPVIAIAPLDKGNAFQSWRKQFVSEVLAGYGAILGLNLFFIIMPILNNINLFPDLGGATSLTGTTPGADVSTTFGGFGGTIYNDLAHLLFTLVGLYMMKDLIKMIGDIAGGSDATGAGEKMAKQAGSAALKVGMAVATGGAALAGGIGSAVAAGKAKSFGGIADGLSGKEALDKLGEKKDKKVKKLENQGRVDEAKALAKMSNEDYAKQLSAEQQNKSSAMANFGKGLMGNLWANAQGTVAKKLNKNFNTQFNEKTTVGDRKKEDENRGVELIKRIDKGEGTLSDYINPRRHKYAKLAAEADREAAQENNATEKVKADNRTTALDKINTANKVLEGRFDRTKIAAQAVTLEGELNSGKYAEDEQTQQLLRTAIQQLKDIANAKDDRTSMSMINAITGDDLKVKLAGTDAMQNNVINSNAKVEILQKLQESGQNITPKLLEETVKKVLTSNSDYKGLDETALRREISAAMKEVLDKKSQ